MGKLDYTRRTAGLFRKAEPVSWPLATKQSAEHLVKSAFAEGLVQKVDRDMMALTKLPKGKRGRPIVSTGDPKHDARNKQQRELMAKRRAKG